MSNAVDRKKVLDPDAYWAGEARGGGSALEHARRMVAHGRLSHAEYIALEKHVAGMLPQMLDMDSYVQGRKDGSVDRILENTRPKNAADVALRESVARKVIADFVGSQHEAGAMTGKEARAALGSVMDDDGVRDDDVAAGKMWARALKATEADPLPEPVKRPSWDKPIETVTEAEAEEGRRRDAAYGTRDNSQRYDAIRKYERRHEQPVDGRGVMSEADSAAIDAEES
jgi:hypothetical protein